LARVGLVVKIGGGPAFTCRCVFDFFLRVTKFPYLHFYGV
jgi:hypothetical protein